MKLKILPTVMVVGALLALATGCRMPTKPTFPPSQWNTFIGSSSDDEGWGITVDSSGNVYVSGWSDASWGWPVNPHAGGRDAFAAKVNDSGTLKWNTFMGSSSNDESKKAIAVDRSGNVYVAGTSKGTWGSPINPYAGGWDAFVAKLNNSGTLQWHTFMGSSDLDHGYGIAVDDSGNVYVAGYSEGSWGTPVSSYAGGGDAFVTKLSSSGALQWNTFMGSSSLDGGVDVGVDGSGNVYVVGRSAASWGTPINGYAGGEDAFVAKLNNSGTLQWNTFMGSSDFELASGIAVDDSGNVYVAGYGEATWGTPINDHAGDSDAFAAKLNSSGVRQWNTFMGSPDYDQGRAIAVDGNGNVYVAGYSAATWGTPINDHAGDTDAFAAKLNSSGVRQWNAFMGSLHSDYCLGITVDSSGNVYVAGYSEATWGTPTNDHAGGWDAFVAKFSGTPDFMGGSR